MLPREEIASRLYGTTRSEGSAGSGGTAVIYGTAVTDSEDGTVKVIPDGAQVTAPDGEDGTLTVPTSPAVQEGDSVMLIGAGGGRQPLSVVSVVGSGDRLTYAIDTVLSDVEGLETLIRETADGVLVAKVGQTVGALVNADGSFDVVSVVWNGNEPTVGASVYSGGEVTRIGREGETYLEVTYNSLRFKDKNGNTFFEVFDNRGQDGYSSQITEEHEVIHIARGIGSYIFNGAGFETVYSPSDIATIEIDGTEYGYDGRIGNAVCVLPSSQGGDALIGKTATIVYRTTQAVQAVTVGTRGSGAVGNRSLTVGTANVASAPGTAAIGSGNEVSGYYGAAFGSHLISNSNNQTVLGTYNEPLKYAPLIVGNGFSESTRHNSLVLDKDGNLEISGAFTGSMDWSNIVNAPPGVEVDAAISATSENPVQNKAISTALNGKQETMDAATNADVLAMFA